MRLIETIRAGRMTAPLPSWRWVLAALALAALAAAFPGIAWETLSFVAYNMALMLPIILVALLLSGAIRASGASGLMSRLFAGRKATMILAAAAFGAITPICGVGVLPIIAGLLAAGAPLAAIMAFWLSSPITDPSMLAITAGTLGLSFAVGKTMIACATGLLGGLATELLLTAGAFRSPLRAAAQQAPACGTGTETEEVRWKFWTEEKRRALFFQDARAAAIVIVKWLTLAFALESILRRYLPPELIAQAVGAGNDWAIPLAVLVGTPIYLDGYAALPLVRSLIDLGMTPGAAMAFLVSGGITSLYASVAVFALVRLPMFIWYLSLAVVCSTLGGYGYQAYVAWLS